MFDYMNCYIVNSALSWGYIQSQSYWEGSSVFSLIKITAWSMLGNKSKFSIVFN